MQASRLTVRKARLWSRSYLAYRYMWPNIERAVKEGRQLIGRDPVVVLDVGCGERPYADLFAGLTYVGVNYGADNALPDVLADAERLPVKTGAVNMVFCTQVIEHIRHPGRFLEEAHRVLERGGILILTGPFYWPLHEEPNDFFRFTKYGFSALLEEAGFVPLEIIPDGGDWAQIGQAIALAVPGYLRIVVPMVNLLALLFDRIAQRTLSPMNYTIIASKAACDE